MIPTQDWAFSRSSDFDKHDVRYAIHIAAQRAAGSFECINEVTRVTHFCRCGDGARQDDERWSNI